MNNTYDISRYKQLLKKRSFLSSQNRSLWKDYPKEDKELQSYRIILSSQLQYNRKNIYLPLIEKYIINQISFASFQSEIFRMFDQEKKIQEDIKKKFELLSNISIDSKLTEFGGIINSIINDCRLSDYPFETDEIDSITDELK